MNTYILAAQTFNLKIETITVLIQVLIYIGREGIARYENCTCISKYPLWNTLWTLVGLDRYWMGRVSPEAGD